MELATDLVLVTGATGWLGKNLVRALTLGLENGASFPKPPVPLRIRCLDLAGQDHSESSALSDSIEFMEGDIRSPQDCQRFCKDARGAILLHTAAVIHPRRVSDFYRVNVEGASNILEASAAAGLARAVVVSSNSPCGCNPHPDHLFDEEAHYNPYMNYGRSKMEVERLVQAKQVEGKLQTVIIRAPWFYGPNQPERQTLFFKMVRDGKMPLVGSGNNKRSMVYMDNLCQGILLAAWNKKASGQTYWVADERPYTMNEIVDTVETLLEKEFNQTCAHCRMRLPSFAGTVATAADALLQRLGIYHQKMHVLSEMNKTIACSVSKAKKELGYAPHIGLEEGMRRSIKWCFERGFLP